MCARRFQNKFLCENFKEANRHFHQHRCLALLIELILVGFAPNTPDDEREKGSAENAENIQITLRIRKI